MWWMINRQPKAVKIPGYPAPKDSNETFWHDMFQSKQFDLRSFALSCTTAESKASYRELYQLVNESLKHTAPDIRSASLTTLTNYFKRLGITVEQRAAFSEAMDCLTAMVTLHIGSEIAPLQDYYENTKTTDNWLNALLESEIRTLNGSPLNPTDGMRTLKHHLGLLEKFDPFYQGALQHLKQGMPFSGQVSLIMQWFQALLGWFKRTFNCLPSVTDDVYLQVANRLFALVVRFYTPQTLPAAEQTALKQWYKEGSKALYEKTTTFTLPKASDKWAVYRRHVTFANRGQCFQFIQKQCGVIKTQLLRIQAYGDYAFKHALVCAITDDADLTFYLTAYQETQRTLCQWSRDAFAFRMYCEKNMRGTPHYLDALDKLDGQLIERHKQRQAIEAGWLSTIESSAEAGSFVASLAAFNPTALAKLQLANQCFHVLNRQAATVKQSMHWLEHACYFTHVHEAEFADEMVARDSAETIKRYRYPAPGEPRKCLLGDKPEATGYHLEAAYTLSDEAVDALGFAMRGMRQLSLKLHPDKNQAIHAVADATFQCFDDIKKRAERVHTAYSDSQFFKTIDGVEPRPFGRPPTHPVKPEASLELSALCLHQAYLNRFKQAHSLVKTPQTVFQSYHLVTTTDDRERALAEHFQGSLVNTLNEHYRLKTERKEQDKLQKELKERQKELDKQLNERDEKLASLAKEKNRILRNSWQIGIKNAFMSVDRETLTADFTLQAMNQMMNSLLEDDLVTREEALTALEMVLEKKDTFNIRDTLQEQGFFSNPTEESEHKYQPFCQRC